MRGIAGFALDVGDQALRRQRREDALMIDLDDVDLLLIEDARDVERRAWTVLQLDPQSCQPPRPREIAQQHVGEQAQVNIIEVYHQRVFSTLPAKGLIT